MKKSLSILFLLAACGSSEQPDNQSAAGDANRPRVISMAGLVGLYESGPVKQPNQLCIIDEEQGPAQFGLILWGGNLHNCSGAGDAVRDGDRLRLTMSGDQACTLDATIKDGQVTLPAKIPEGCAYYCGARARLDGATFTKKGDTVADALKATDLVGEPLCTAPRTDR